MNKIIVHIDLNTFFVRAEEIKNPLLENKAVAIGHKGRSGVVSTCSYEARKFGVHSGMPMFKALELCPHLIVIPSDFRFYKALSDAFFNFVKKYTPLVEIASVDECFADFTAQLENVKDKRKYFQSFQEELFDKLKLKCSIGVSSTKFLAKMGSDYKKPMGITFIDNTNIDIILGPLDVSNMYGIGKKTVPILKKMNIITILDLKNRINSGEEPLKELFGKFYFDIKDWLNGRGNDVVVVEPDDPKSIGNSTTLPHDTNYAKEILETIESLCGKVSSRAIKENKTGMTISLNVKDANFESYSRATTIKQPTNKKEVIFDCAKKLFEKHFTDMTLRLVGVTLQNLLNSSDYVEQMDLFSQDEYENNVSIDKIIDSINKKVGKSIVKRGSEVENKDGNN